MKYTLSLLVLGTSAFATPLTSTLLPRDEGKKFRVGLQSQQRDINCHQTDKCVERGWGTACITYETKCDTIMEDKWFTYTISKDKGATREKPEPHLCLTSDSEIWKNFVVQHLSVDEETAFRGVDLVDRNQEVPLPHGRFGINWCGPKQCYYEANGENEGILVIGEESHSCTKVQGSSATSSDPLYIHGGDDCPMFMHRRNVIECAF